MKCPNCKSRKFISVEDGDGYTPTDTRECGDCGAVWYHEGKELKFIKEGMEVILG